MIQSGETTDKKEIQTMIKQADQDGDGEIDFAEFRILMKKLSLA